MGDAPSSPLTSSAPCLFHHPKIAATARCRCAMFALIFTLAVRIVRALSGLSRLGLLQFPAASLPSVQKR
jgi:hypothetical protein